MIAFFEVEVDELYTGYFRAVIDYFGYIGFGTGRAHLLGEESGIGYFEKEGVPGHFVVLEFYVGVVIVQVTDDGSRRKGIYIRGEDLCFRQVTD